MNQKFKIIDEYIHSFPQLTQLSVIVGRHQYARYPSKI